MMISSSYLSIAWNIVHGATKFSSRISSVNLFENVKNFAIDFGTYIIFCRKFHARVLTWILGVIEVFLLASFNVVGV
jgi:hypothetical protein